MVTVCRLQTDIFQGFEHTKYLTVQKFINGINCKISGQYDNKKEHVISHNIFKTCDYITYIETYMGILAIFQDVLDEHEIHFLYQISEQYNVLKKIVLTVVNYYQFGQITIFGADPYWCQSMERVGLGIGRLHSRLALGPGKPTRTQLTHNHLT